MSLLDAARTYAAHGWNILPISLHKTPHPVMILTGHWQYGKGQRKVAHWKPFQRERVTDHMLRVWFDPQYGVPGLAGVTGEISGRVVLDFDGEPGARLYVGLGVPASAFSGSGGAHVYVQWPGHPVSNRSSASLKSPPFPGLDVRGDGGLIILPPSHLSNGPYQLGSGQTYAAAQLPEAVARWTRLTIDAPPELPVWEAPEADLAFDEESLLEDALQRVQVGASRDNTGYWLACRLLDQASPQRARAIMQRYAECMPAQDSRGRHAPYTWADAERNLRSAQRRGAAPAHRPPARRQGQIPDSPLTLLRQILPGLSEPQRAHAAQLVAGAYLGEGVDAARETLRQLGLDPTVADTVQRQLDAHYSVPGMTSLKRFVKRNARGRAT